jgi:hypothetical protein
LRDWLNTHSAPVIVGCVALIALGMALLSARTAPKERGPSDEAWYYDVVTKSYFQDKRVQVPPIRSPAGNEAVRVAFYSCGDCGGGERFAGYYLKYEPEAKARIEKSGQVVATFGEKYEGRLYSTDGEHWVRAVNPDKAGVTDQLLKHPCGSGWLHPCR